MATQTLCERIGHPPDARLLIVNADDFGMCHAENLATMAGLTAGVYTSSTIMTPCAWFGEAATFARENPRADLGVHLTQTSEWRTYKWGPVSGRSAVPSLVDAGGHFFPDIESVYRSARLDDVERETRAQVDQALAAGIDVTHLDSHMGTLQLDVNYHAIYVRLAAEYRLPIRMARRQWMKEMGMGEIVRQVDDVGILTPDHFYYGGPPSPAETAAHWTALLRALKPGVSEIYVHAGLDHPELRAMCPAWEQRVADHQFFTAPSTRALLGELGIVLVGYRSLREAQRLATR